MIFKAVQPKIKNHGWEIKAFSTQNVAGPIKNAKLSLQIKSVNAFNEIWK